VNTIYLTGSSGFVGTNLQSYLLHDFQIRNHFRDEVPVVKEDIVIHLAGMAHDTKNFASYKEYYQVNTEFTKDVFDAFLNSSARVFITLSSVKAAADEVKGVLTEDISPHPQTHYGKSKLLAEQYILSKKVPPGKRIYIMRPCMIHGPGNKGNLNLLYRVVSKNLPWPLAAFQNQRSFCSIQNLCFVINELITREDITSGVYNMADDEALSTNDLIRAMAESLSRRPCLLPLPVVVVRAIARLGDLLRLPLNTERLQKLTESYIVSNLKLTNALGKPLPVKAKEGLINTLPSFRNHLSRKELQ
jgi:nucleoside-diphosphate-sugar epimerase